MFYVKDKTVFYRLILNMGIPIAEKGIYIEIGPWFWTAVEELHSDISKKTANPVPTVQGYDLARRR